MTSVIEQWMRGVEDKIAELDRRLRSNSTPLPGTVMMWAGATEPPGYLFCRGQTFQSTQYPALAAVVGDTYGTHTGTTYFLPDFNARSPIGVGGVASPSTGGNNYSLGLKWGHEAVGQHSHSASTGADSPDHAHQFPSYGYTNSFGWSNTGGLYLFPLLQSGLNGAINSAGRTVSHTHSVTVSNNSTANTTYGNVHPVLGINFIIKT